MEKTIIFNDTHHPFQDKKTCDLLLDFIKREQPDSIIANGDILDCYKISRFDKDPTRKKTFSDEIDSCYWFLSGIVDAVGYDCEIIYIEGNHEARLQRYLWSKAPELADLECLTIKGLLWLEELGIQYCENSDKGKFHIYHGSLVRQEAGYTAKAEFLKNGCSGITGHCFDEETDVLTGRGWLPRGMLSPDDIVGTMNKNTGGFEWNYINEFHDYDDYKEMYHIKSTVVDLLVTGEHGLLCSGKGGKKTETTACELFEAGKRTTFFNSVKGQNIAPLNKTEEYRLRLMINLLADGCIEGGACRWHLKKARKIAHLEDLLDGLDIVYSKKIQKGGTFKIRISKADVKSLMPHINEKKIMPEWFARLTKPAADIALNEYSITDGCKNSAAQNSYQLCSAKEREIEILQQLFISNGYRATKNDRGDCFTLTVNTRPTSVIEKRNITKVPYNGKVWCLNVDNGTLIVRRNGKVTVTLNTHRDAKYTKRTRGGHFVWYENFCLCDLDAEYIKGVANWTQGWSMLTDINGRQYVEQVPVINHRYTWRGKEYK